MSERMFIAFTGSRNRLSDAQQFLIDLVITGLPAHVVYVTGACVGVDAYVARLAHIVGRRVHTVVPMVYTAQFLDTHWMDHCDTSEEASTYRSRNTRMVELSDRLIAFPAYPENDSRSRRSGTWQTIRMARKAGKAVQVYVLDKQNGGAR